MLDFFLSTVYFPLSTCLIMKISVENQTLSLKESINIMKAIAFQNYGNVEQLIEIELPQPEATENKILVEIYATSVNPFDAKLREGLMKERMHLPLPFIPGLDLAGVIRAVGPGVTNFHIGDEIYGRTRPGGASAEYALVDPGSIARKPAVMSFEEAAGIPTGALTAYYGLTLFGKIKAGESVLVQGGAGGTGIFTVQIARALGARVSATCRGRDVELVRMLGADPVINYEIEDFLKILKQVDVVVNTAGMEVANRSLDVLGPGGRYVGYAGSPDPTLAEQKGVTVIVVQKLDNTGDPEALAYINKLYEQGQLKVVIGQTLPLTTEGVREAHRLIETHGHPAGKIIIKVK